MDLSVGAVLKRLRKRARGIIGSLRLARALAVATERRIVIGAGGFRDPRWISTERNVLDLLDASGWQRFFEPDSIHALLAEHVWEHLTATEGCHAAAVCYRFLKPGGYLRVAVPDGYNPSPTYIELVKAGGTGAGAADHKLLYTYESLAALFRRVGFEVSLLEYFDERGRFHAVAWDPRDGMIRRSRRFDPRNRAGALNWTSLIVDATKPGVAARQAQAE